MIDPKIGMQLLALGATLVLGLLIHVLEQLRLIPRRDVCLQDVGQEPRTSILFSCAGLCQRFSFDSSSGV